jgi:small ubiquitin-related modifier
MSSSSSSSSGLGALLDQVVAKVQATIVELGDRGGSSKARIKKALGADADEMALVTAALKRGTANGVFARAGNKYRIRPPPAPDVKIVGHMSLEERLRRGAKDAVIVEDKPPQKIAISFKDQGGDETFFICFTTMKMSKLFHIYAKRKGVERTVFRFMIDGEAINDDATPRSLELEDRDQVDVLLEQTGDIGIFGAHANSPGIMHLTTREHLSRGAASKLIKTLNANPNACFLNQKEPGILVAAQRDTLMQHVDAHWNGKSPDFKLPLSNAELAKLVGEKSYAQLRALMRNTHDAILLRRCMEHGKAIKFHTDHSFKTLQVPLNEKYVGGRLVYVTQDGMTYPDRSAGSFTLHRNDILHGVTRLESGVRYGLFMLQKKETA